MELVSFLLGSAIAFNVGIVNSASGMALAYGSGVLKRSTALLLTALFAFLGGILLGGNIIGTLSSGLFHTSPSPAIPSLIVVPAVVLAVLILASLAVVPVSSTQIITGAFIGLAIIYGSLNITPALTIASLWVLTPLISGLATFITVRIAGERLKVFIGRQNRKVLQLLLVIIGSYSAFSNGINMTGKSASFLVVSGVLSPFYSRVAAALIIAVAMILLGRFLIDNVGKKIFNLGITDAIVISVVSTTTILAAAVSGIPVCQNQVILASITGAAFSARSGFKIKDNKVLKRSYTSWAIAPIAVVFLTYSITRLFIS